MKKIITILIGCTLIACAEKSNQNTNKNLNITGEVEGIRQGTLYLKTLKDSNLVVVDSFLFNNNQNFEFSLNIDEPKAMVLELNRGASKSENNHIVFFAEQGEISIKSSLQNFFNAQIKGSKTQEVYDKYLSFKNELMNKQLEFIKQKTTAQRLHQVHQIEIFDKKLINIQKKIYLNAVNFAINHNHSIVAPYITLTDIIPTGHLYVKEINDTLTKEVKNSYYGKILDEYVKNNKL